jgi:hypothetical protein
MPERAGCHFCGNTERELRPYGPKGAPICFGCMKADPAREAAAREQFGRKLEDAGRRTGAAAVGSELGPVPFIRPGGQRDA